MFHASVRCLRERPWTLSWVPLLLALAVAGGPALAAAAALTGGAAPDLEAAERVIVLPFVSYVAAPDEDGATGELDLYEVVIRRNREPRIRVGFLEDRPGGVAPTMRHAGWLAAVVGARLAGVPLDEVSIVYDVPGYVAGPSAGALMTVGVAAGLLGHELDPATTMTGTIQPDGTIGPVDGIPEKILAAAETGGRTVFIPLGQRHVTTDAGDVIDVVAFGEALGVDVQEVGDVGAAYAAMTGRPLPGPEPEPGSLAELLPRTVDTLLEMANERAYRVVAALDALEQLGETPDPLAVQIFDQAGQAAAAGRAALAYERVLRAGSLADAQFLVVSSGLQEALAAEDPFLMLDAWETLWSELETSLEFLLDLLNLVADGDPTHLTDVPLLLEIDGVLLEGTIAADLGFQSLEYAAELLLEGTGHPDELAEAARLMQAAAELYGTADWALVQAFDLLQLTMAVPFGGDSPDPQLVERQARVEMTGVLAALEYLDIVWLEDTALDLGIDPEDFRLAFATQEPDYFLAQTLLGQLLTADESDPYMLLAGALRISPRVTRLVNLYYSTPDFVLDKVEKLLALVDGDAGDAETGISEDGSADGTLADQPLMDHMLAWAEDGARRAIARVRALGVEPALSLMHLEVATALRDGGPADQVDALQAFWRAEALARVTAALARER